jgi:hypothetical protein
MVALGTVVVLLTGFVLNAAVAYLLVRRFADDGALGDESGSVRADRSGGEAPGRDGRRDDGAAPGPGDDAVVACSECGAANDAEYRFCRQCVAELPGPSGVGGSTPSIPRGMVR